MYTSSETEEILIKIRGGDESILKECYLAYKEEFINWIQKKFNAPRPVGEELYHEAFLTFYENVLSEKLVELNSNLKTYIFSIGKYKYLDHSRREQRHLEFTKQQVEVAPEQLDEPIYDTAQLNAALKQLGEPCAGLLRKFYFDRSSMKEIAEIMGYSSIASAKNQKYKCIKRLRDLFKKNNKHD